DLYGLLQRDTTGVGGAAELDIQVGGTSAAPTFRGLARLAGGRFGDFQSPFVQGVLNYEGRRLDANLDLWRTGENLLQVEAHLPLDLALTGVEHRRIDGPLSVRAHTDSVSLGLLEAITPAVTRVGGTLEGDSVRLRDLALTSGGGQLKVGGSVRLEELSKPTLALDFRAEQFR